MKTVQRSNILFLVCLLIFVDAIGIGLVLPIMPKLFYSNQGLARLMPSGAINFFYGLTMAAFPLAAMIGKPILGDLSDKFGRKKMMLWGIVGLALGYFICIIAIVCGSICLFLMARILSGFSSGTYSICYAAVMDLSKNESEKMNGLKYLTLIHVAGFMLGPALSFFVSDTMNALWVLIIPFLIAGVISLVNFILMVFMYPEGEKKLDQTKKSLWLTMSALVFVFRQNFGTFLYAYVLFNLGLQVYIQAQAVYLMKMYCYTASQIGLFYIVMGIAATIGMFVLHPKIRKFFDAALQVKVGMLLMSCLLLLHMFLTVGLHIPLREHIICTWMLSILVYMANPFVTLNMTRMFSDLVSKEIQGKLMGALGQIESLTTVIGSLLMAIFLYWGNDFGTGFSGIILLISFFMMCFVLRQEVSKNKR